MQPIELIKLLVMFLSAIGIILLFCVRDKKTKVRCHPSPACQVMKYYDRDYINIARELENARNIYHLEFIRQAIVDFKYRYKEYQESKTLKTDVNRLTKEWKEMKTSFEIRMAIF